MTNRKKLLIVGGVAGGASCAARARRLSEDVGCGLSYCLKVGKGRAKTYAGSSKENRTDKEKLIQNKTSQFF